MRRRAGRCSPLPEKIRAKRVHIPDFLLLKHDQDAEREHGGEGSRLDRDAHQFGEETARCGEVFFGFGVLEQRGGKEEDGGKGKFCEWCGWGRGGALL